MEKLPELFGEMVFNDAVMRERLPKDTYKALVKVIKTGGELTLDIATIVANAMKDWAASKGATHFTHVFQPLTGITAEKHDSFISPAADGKIILEFSGKELIKGEPDASSFPSGGIRATFEARGYTAWDPTSYAFVKDGSLCIPTAFCSYTGEALDKKTPLLRSMQAIDTQALRILKLFGGTAGKVSSTVGPEQEYFLINKEDFFARKDLVTCGRTLFGAKPPKGQELEDHYFGVIKPRVSAYMKDLDEELWKYGILAKTKHNEVAPSQHELAVIYGTTNVATDQNQLVMETMKRVAGRHGLACLLHEKPFAGINGSGKHNNWSLATDTGVNLLDPGTTPEENAQFLLLLTAVISAVDEYQGLLRATVASAGNDHRLGASEAPPAIISIFLGEELTAVVDSITGGTKFSRTEVPPLSLGVTALPKIPKDNTDRNRTSPFAFTGNKFEFRMPGSAFSISDCNFVLNTIVAEQLSRYADKLEKIKTKKEFKETLHTLVKDELTAHKNIIFNGNGYDDSWVVEAERRGLLNLKNTMDALPQLIEEKNIEVLEKHGVLSREESESRYEVFTEQYAKILTIEALTMIDMANKDILPAVENYVSKLAKTAKAKLAVSPDLSIGLERRLLFKLSEKQAQFYNLTNELSEVLEQAEHVGDSTAVGLAFKTEVVPAMAKLRAVGDELEEITDAALWPFPVYSSMLFNV
ncbi:MAG: glutamine synthetase III [Christensenellaceae bacterium]|jgi:glutamine synthetase|nr:glutamine synthetase III [Christensenellaceae bacterium]